MGKKEVQIILSVSRLKIKLLIQLQTPLLNIYL